jgi:hypothetical protein
MPATGICEWIYSLILVLVSPTAGIGITIRIIMFCDGVWSGNVLTQVSQMLTTLRFQKLQTGILVVLSMQMAVYDLILI